MVRPLTIALLYLATLMAPVAAQVPRGAFVNPTGRPIGGGEDYGAWVPAPMFRGGAISAPQELIDALARAKPGTVVYVADSAIIDLTGRWEIGIPAGVTLASGRGRSGSLGALLFNTKLEAHDQFRMLGANARITGLRLRGPDLGIAPLDCGGNDSTAIGVHSPTSVYWQMQIDNNEVWGWPGAGVSTTNVHGLQVHHNHIHHNRREVAGSRLCRGYGLGYGVVTWQQGNVLVEANLFDHNRHDIASDGRPGTMYEARYNLVLSGAWSQSFDVHGGADRHDGTDIAGNLFNIHHNTFLQGSSQAFLLRGRPVTGAYVWANDFRHRNLSEAVRQKNASGNLWIWDNTTQLIVPAAWFLSFSGESQWRLRRLDSPAIASTAFADFEGDGITDAFQVRDGQWFMSRGARAEWAWLNTSNVAFADLRFGDFDGDGRTDVFRSHGGDWYVSYGGTTAWQWLNHSSVSLSKLAFGDFDGDRRTDVLWADGSRWNVSWGGTSAWSWFNNSSYTIGELNLGDFDGDGRIDVFRTDGANWYVSWAGTSAWAWINSSSAPRASLGFADLDGDRATDVFRANGSNWYVSRRGASAWQWLVTSSLTVSQLAFGDFNGDRKADVLSRQNP